MARRARALYGGLVEGNAIRSLWAEPRVPDPPRRVWRDWALVGVLVPAAVLESILREEVTWRPAALVITVAAIVLLLWRRTSPLPVVAGTFGLMGTGAAAWLLGAGEPVGLYSAASVLLVPYSLLRWAAGREVVIGLSIIVVVGAVCIAADFTGVVEAVAGMVILLFPAVLGASVRYRTGSRLRELDQIRLREREELARGLHDTVAHHVSAIAIHAQAGRALAASRPDAAVDALAVIEEAASRTLTEMRSMVGALRRPGEVPDLLPQRGLADIEGLAMLGGEGPRVDVELSGDLEGLRPMVEAAIYRVVQESITNAVRHARTATRIAVSVAGENGSVRVTVRDDGAAVPFGGAGSATGYGLVGMTERAALLGGALEAGPDPAGGWAVRAVLPRNGTPA
ncbi:MAG: sensor histidine kinase [Actinobacteria bacterium]|nr:sensor histidine kinase [Actinomycetota bacterium]